MVLGELGFSANTVMVPPPTGPVCCHEPDGGVRVTFSAAIPDLVASSEEVAVTVAEPVVLEGAVYVAVSFAVDAIVPRLAAQVTVGSKLPVP